MDFRLTDEQVGFGEAIRNLMKSAHSVAVARAWAAGRTETGVALWHRLADLGVTALIIPEAEGGLGGNLVDLAVAFEALGHELAVGPWIESAALLPQLDGDIVTAAVPGLAPYAVDTHVAQLTSGIASTREASVDTTRQLSLIEDADELDAASVDRAILACAAELLGAGERLLEDSVDYAKQRTQYGRLIGSYQAIKHQLADVRISLDFARPLVYGAALGVTPVSAAKLAAAEASYHAARVGLQVHGAIGYTAECDLSLWILRVRALVSAWGTPSFHRARLADHLMEL